MKSLKLVEAVLESLPQLSIQTYAFFTIGGDSLVFIISASISMLTIFYAWYNFLASRQDILKAMAALRAIFGVDAANPPSPQPAVVLPRRTAPPLLAYAP